MDQFIIAYLIVGFIFAIKFLYNEEEMKKPGWFYSVFFVTLAWFPITCFMFKKYLEDKDS